MKIRTTIECVTGRYNVQVEVYSLTSTEEQKVAEFGDPLIDVGGGFSGSATRPNAGSPTTVTFSLPTATRRLTNDSPFKQVFDLADSADSDVKAKVWADTVATRATAAKNTLVAQTPSFEGETVTTI